MIGRLRGEIIDRTANTVVVDVNGVGYVATVPERSTYRVGERVDLYVHTHVREDVIHLFGFADPIERDVFNLLISVPNVGPVKAMGILATPVGDLIDLVSRREAGRLSKLPGVGKKTAERLLVDLADKMAALAPHGVTDSERPNLPAHGKVADDLVSALVNLGFRSAAAEDAAQGAIERLGGGAQLEALLKDALTQVSR